MLRTESKLTITELYFAVVLSHFNLESAVFTNVGCQTGQTLSTTASNTHQQHITTGLPDDSNNLRNFKTALNNSVLI